MNSFNRIILSRSDFFKRMVIFSAILFFLLAGVADSARAQAISENFDNITLLPSRGWFTQNNSVPVGLTGWLQGNNGIFLAQAGAANSYIAANFNNTTGTNTISNWLGAPNLTLHNGDVIRFWTRTTRDNPFPDRLEVRLSTNGASTNVGTTNSSVGDFTTLLLSINPNLELGGYPEFWTQYAITLSGLPAGGASGRVAFRYYVTEGGPTGDNSNYIGIDTFSINSPNQPQLSAPLDFNGDGKTDYAIVRNTGGSPGGEMTWFIHNGAGYTERQWGLSTDIPVAGDFDGDGKDDLTVYRPEQNNSYFYTLRSSDGTVLARQLGTLGDNPSIVGDYSGDGVDDYAVYRQGASAGQPSFWYYRHSVLGESHVFTAVQYGAAGDTPAPGDYDGDNRFDFCVRRDNGDGQGVFYLKKSTGGDEAVFWGAPDDLIAPGDYDGDDRTDFAVARRSDGHLLWSVLGRSNNNIIHFGEQWGIATDFPAQGDYDGDGKADIAVWRLSADPDENFFYVRKSSDGALIAFEWGQPGDYPVASFNSH
jgi:hypothetical protein